METRYEKHEFLRPEHLGNSPNTLLIKKNYLLSQWYHELKKKSGTDKSMFTVWNYWPLAASFVIGSIPFHFLGRKAKNWPAALMTTTAVFIPFMTLFHKNEIKVKNQFLRSNYHFLSLEDRKMISEYDEEKMDKLLPKDCSIAQLETKIEAYFDVD